MVKIMHNAAKKFDWVGFRINYRRSQLVPTQLMDYLGVTWSTQNKVLLPAKKNILKAEAILAQAMTKRTRLKTYLQLLGILNFLCRLVSGLLTLFTQLYLHAPQWSLRTIQIHIAKGISGHSPLCSRFHETPANMSTYMNGCIEQLLGSCNHKPHPFSHVEGISSVSTYYDQEILSSPSRPQNPKAFAEVLSLRLLRLLNDGFT